MKKKLLIVLCLVLAITLTGCGKKSAKIEEKEEKGKNQEITEKDDNYVISYKDSDALDQIPTKEVNGVNYKSFSIKNGDALDVYVIINNDSDVTRKYMALTFDETHTVRYDSAIIYPNNTYEIKLHYDNSEGYSVEQILSLLAEGVVAVDDNLFEYDSYNIEKRTLYVYFKYNGEVKVSANIFILGLKDGKIIGCGEGELKKVNDEGAVETDGVIANKGDKAVAVLQNIKLSFDLEDSDQILYFINGQLIG